MQNDLAAPNEPEARNVGQIDVVVVDDHELAREGTKRLLAEDSQIRVVGESATAGGAIALVKSMRPHVVLMDIRLGRESGIEATRVITRELPHTKVVGLTAYHDWRYTRAMAAAGACDVIDKGVTARELTAAVCNAIHLSGRYIPDSNGGSEDVGRPERRGSNGRLEAPLTPRELQVLKQMVDGMKNREIADAMGISLRTVETHADRIRLKLGARTRTEAAVTALKHGWFAEALS